MHFLSSYQGSYLVFSLYLSLTNSMNLNLEFGKPFLLTYSGFYMQQEGLSEMVPPMNSDKVEESGRAYVSAECLRMLD